MKMMLLVLFVNAMSAVGIFAMQNEMIKSTEFTVKNGTKLKIHILKSNHCKRCFEKECDNSILKAVGPANIEDVDSIINEFEDINEIKLVYTGPKNTLRKCDHETVPYRTSFKFSKDFFIPGIYRVTYPKILEAYIGFEIMDLGL
jgi:hypothetical protein